MVGRRNGEGIIGMARQVEDRARVALHLLAGGIVEALGPVEAAIRLVPLHAAQIVDDIAAAKDHDAFVAQSRQPRA